MPQFKKDDRVRWTGAYDKSLAYPEAVGTAGTVAADTGSRCTTKVDWDVTEERRMEMALGTGIYNGNLERIDMINVTKPLYTKAPSEAYPRRVTYLATTDKGEIIVETPNHAALSWVIFTADGAFVRSSGSGNTGCALTLTNPPEPVEKDIYIRIGQEFNVRDQQISVNNHPQGGTGVAVIKVSVKDGIVTGAKLHRANEEKIGKISAGSLNSEIPLV